MSEIKDLISKVNELVEEDRELLNIKSLLFDNLEKVISLNVYDYFNELSKYKDPKNNILTNKYNLFQLFYEILGYCKRYRNNFDLSKVELKEFIELCNFLILKSSNEEPPILTFNAIKNPLMEDNIIGLIMTRGYISNNLTIKKNEFQDIYKDVFTLPMGMKIYFLTEQKGEFEYLVHYPEKDLINQMSEKKLKDYLKLKLNNVDFDMEIIVEKIFKQDYYSLNPANRSKRRDEDFVAPTHEQKLKFILNQIITNEVEEIDNLGYLPKGKLIYEKDNRIYFNTYRDSKLIKKYNSLSSKKKKEKISIEDFPIIYEVAFNLVGEEIEGFDWLCMWIADILQDPLNKKPTAPIFKGGFGSGKGTFLSCLEEIFGSNYVTVTGDALEKDYNEFMRGKLLTIYEELKSLEDDKKSPEKIKNLISEKKISINQRFRDVSYEDNFSRTACTSNNYRPIHLQEGDRRFSIFESATLPNGYETYQKLQENFEEECFNFLRYLMNLEINPQHISKPLDNIARKELINYSKNSVEEFISYVGSLGGFWETYLEFLKMGVIPQDFQFTKIIYKQTNDYVFSNNELYDLYYYFCRMEGFQNPFHRKNFLATLSPYSIKSEVIKYEKKSLRILDIRNFEKESLRRKTLHEKEEAELEAYEFFKGVPVIDMKNKGGQN